LATSPRPFSRSQNTANRVIASKASNGNSSTRSRIASRTARRAIVYLPLYVFCGRHLLASKRLAAAPVPPPAVVAMRPELAA
jgi:hypothetical protein